MWVLSLDRGRLIAADHLPSPLAATGSPLRWDRPNDEHAANLSARGVLAFDVDVSRSTAAGLAGAFAAWLSVTGAFLAGFLSRAAFHR